MRVDGDDRYSEAKLTGWFDPPLVLKCGYSSESFSAGPLTAAMQGGAVLFINELNRMPESVQNVLLPALDEGLLQVPHIGEVRAAPGFQVIATQNPVEYVATGHLSEALRDRFEHLELAYQSEAEEQAIVSAESGSADAALVATAVRLVRATRVSPRLRKGASVRGAIALVALAEGLRAQADGAGDERALLRRAAEAALTTRVELRDEAASGFDAVLDELFALVVDAGGEGGARRARPPQKRLSAPAGARLSRRRPMVVRSQPGERRAQRGASMTAIAERFELSEAGLDGWDIAVNLTRPGRRIADPGVRLVAERLAAQAVLARAHRLVGPLRLPTRPVREVLREPHGGELDVEAHPGQRAGQGLPRARRLDGGAPRGAAPAGGHDGGHVAQHVGREHGHGRRGRGRAGTARAAPRTCASWSSTMSPRPSRAWARATRPKRWCAACCASP